MADLSRVKGMSFNGVTIDNKTAENIFVLDVKKDAVAEMTYISYDIPNRDGTKFEKDK